MQLQEAGRRRLFDQPVVLSGDVNDGFFEYSPRGDAIGELDPLDRRIGDGTEESLAFGKESGVD